jgi:hypothetical protein
MKLVLSGTRLTLIALIALGVLIGALRLAGPEKELYPVEGDSAKYHSIGSGFARLYAHPFSSFRLWITRSATQSDLQRLGFDSWVLQHAPAYTAILGLFYLLPGDDAAAGRLLTVLIFAIGAALLYLLGREIFGPWAGLIAALLYLFWPAHWFYAPAILTEVPMAVAGLLAAYGMIRTAGSDRPRRWALGGIAIGLLVLTKTPLRFLAVPWIVLEALIDRSGGPKRVTRRAGFRIAGWGATQIVWLLFLWGFHLSPNPLKSLGEDWLWVYRGDYVPDRGWETLGIGDAVTPELEEGSRRAELVPADQRKGEMYRRAFDATLRNHPGGMAALILAKAGIYWRFPAVKTFVRAGPLSLPPPRRLQPALAVAALIGLALCAGNGGSRRILPAIVPGFLTLLYAGTHLVSRYNIPAIPFAMLYGAGAAVALAEGVRSAMAHARSGLRAFIRAGRPAGGAVLCLAAGFVLLSVLPGQGAVGVVAVGAATLGAAPLLIRLFGGGRLGFARALIVIAPLFILAAGVIADSADPDGGRVRLNHPGDGVRLRLSLPPEAKPQEFVASEVLLDLLPSPRGRMTLSIRLSGTEIARFDGRPPSGPDSFLLDPDIHREGERYRRILRSMERHLEGYVRRQPGMGNAGYDYYRQWYRVPVDPGVAFASAEPILEIVLIATDGGTIDLFVDWKAPPSGTPQRVIEMPAFFENAYELSYYRFDTLASTRELADSRLIRPVRLMSSRLAAERFDAQGRTHAMRGEPRMRLRGKLPGGYALVKGANGAAEPAYLADPSKAIRMLSPPEIRFLQADRDRYFDGYLTF